MSSKTDSSFLRQGALLAAAGIISRIIGLIYRIPLTNIIGKTGSDYYATAFEIYNIVLIISSYSIPLVMSKMIAQRISQGYIKESRRVYRIGMGFGIFMGGAAALIVFFGAEFFAGNLLNTIQATIALKILAPTLFVVAILGVIRGYFQGMGTMVPTAASQIVEQVVNAIVSVLAAYYLFSFGTKVIVDGVDQSATYGAAGGTLGTLSGAVAAFVLLIFMYLLWKPKIKGELTERKESTKKILKTLMLTLIPVLLSTTLYNVSSVINQGIYKSQELFIGTDGDIISKNWGTFAGQYRVLINVPVSIAIAMASSIVPSLVISFKK